MRRKFVFAGVGFSLLALLVTLSLSSCSQQANAVAVRSFELAQKVDFVCMQVFRPLDNGQIVAIPPRPTVPADCAPVPSGISGRFFFFHLYAVVTQLGRGEVAVVDLTSGAVVDLDRETPGINFVPVGAQPTDVAVAPDGKMTFVAAAEPNKPAIYGIPNRDLLGDSQDPPPASIRPAPRLSAWPVCALPQKPGAMAIVPRVLSGDVDAGGPPESAYDVVVVLPGEGGRPSRVVTLDPKPFLRGANPVTPGPGDADLDKLETSEGPRIEPGSLADCPITSAVDLSGDMPSGWRPGPEWDDGIPKTNGALPSQPHELPPTPGCVNTPVGGSPADAGDAGVADAGDAGVADAGTDAGEEYPIEPPLQSAPLGLHAARDGQTLYVADGALPLIHVIDFSGGAPRELPPLLATSQLNPGRQVSVGQIAVSPPTRAFKKYLYAIDRKEGTLMVFDITDPATSPRVPLSRPHAETSPFQLVDRISFGSPVASVSFVRHDFSPRDPRTGALVVEGARGLLCNPNPNASATNPDDPSFDYGTLFRQGALNQDPNVILRPQRLRGIFAFATLSTGRMFVIDVDDWDAPCRRPANMGDAVSAIAPGQPNLTDRDPYHAPSSTGTSEEYFFPMSAPHRMRSQYLVRSDATSTRVPVIDTRPQLVIRGTTVPVVGPDGVQNPLMMGTATGLRDPLGTPTIPGVRLSYESPDVHFDQDWAVAYEGVIPGTDGLVGVFDKPYDGDQTVTLTQPAALFCRRGIEDLRIGSVRAKDQLAERTRADLIAPPADLPLDRRIVDYVQVTDELLDVNDPYWRDPPGDAHACFGPSRNGTTGDSLGIERHDDCAAAYGGFSGVLEPSVFRDFPILEAYDDRLVLGRYYYPRPPAQEIQSHANRVAVGKDSSNAGDLGQLRCCFHNQVHFRVRTGGQWRVLGSAVGFSHHMTKDPSGACVSSCLPREQLLNGRVPAIPMLRPGGANGTGNPFIRENEPLISRNSVLAIRNPAMSFAIYNGHVNNLDVLPLRDATWSFTSRGGYSGLSINLAIGTTSVSPQTMRFVEAFQQLAIVDGAAQGLVLIDLNNLALAHSPYF